MAIARWLSIKPTLVNALKASISYAPQTPTFRKTVKSGSITHTYTGRVPIPNMTIHLTWDPNPVGENVTNYKVYAGFAPDTYNVPGSPFSAGTATVYNLTLSPPAIIYMRLSAVNATGESALTTEIHN